MLRRTSVGFIFIILLVTLITGCGAGSGGQSATSAGSNTASEQNDPVKVEGDASVESRTIKHDLGETVLQGTPEKVVVLELGFIDALLDVGIKPIGVADDNKPSLILDDALTQIEGYTSVGMRSQPSLEKIKLLSPDLIIADTGRHSGAYAELSKIAPTIALNNLDAGYEDTIQAALTIGEAVNKKAEMEEVVAEHQTKLKAIQSKVTKDKNSLVLVGNTDSEITVRNTEFFTAELLKTIGYRYALDDVGAFTGQKGNVKMTIEQFLDIDPDMIVLMSGEVDKKDEEGRRPILEDPLWNELSAVKNNKMYDVNRYTWSLRRSIKGANQIMDQLDSDIIR
ncbi:ABC transporter substrate-binding protein [Paenibacillus jiagnxiensis]|uniref:ABC transporter substrate-binding protein n=1 Tax=Paenibacillus jiagnxiensis TaxID=3228926 RepID=UPI0033BAF91D